MLTFSQSHGPDHYQNYDGVPQFYSARVSWLSVPRQNKRLPSPGEGGEGGLRQG